MPPKDSIFTPKPIPRTINSRIGLGTLIKTATTAMGIRPCGGCRRRAKKLDQMFPNVNPFAR
jgi:hypothetical protein